MKVISVNVGLPKLVEYNGEPIATAIFKSPVAGKILVGQFNLKGDRQADLTVHGGRNKSVYVYPTEHYSFWREELPDAELSWGVFGENLSITGLIENEVRPGDRLRIGTAEFEVTIPRYPCYKLCIRFGRKDILRRFMQSRRSGFYLAVLKTGELEAGDTIEFTSSGRGQTIADIFAERSIAKN